MTQLSMWTKGALVAMSFMIAENAQAESLEAPYFCEMSRSEAAKSPDCLRYFMECATPNPKNVATSLAGLPAAQLANLFYESSARLAAQHCVKFSYQEAIAAIRLHHVDERQ